MGPSTRLGGAALIAALLLTFISAVAPGGARPQATSAASAYPPVVSPFFIVPWSKSNRPRTLTRLRIRPVTRHARVISACFACGKTKFVRTLGSDGVTLSPSRPLRMRSTTRVLVGVTVKGSTGRWIVIGFQRGQYRGLGHGCMPASVTSLTPAEAAHSSAIPRALCVGASPDSEYLYWNGTDSQLYELQYAPPRWGTSVPIGSGNRVGSAPTAVVLSSGERDVFWKRTDGGIYEMSYTGFWSNREKLPARGKLDSAPSAVVDAQNVVHLFYKGSGRFVWAMADRGGVWAPAYPLNSGPVGSAPAAVVRHDGSLDLFWKAGRWLYEMPAGQLAHKLPGAGTPGSGPTAVVDARGIEHVFWRGTNGWLWELSDPDAHGSVAVPLNSGPLGSAPSAVSHPDGVLDVFWRGTNGGLREMQWYLGQWHPSVPVPGAGKLGSQPAAALGP